MRVREGGELSQPGGREPLSEGLEGELSDYRRDRDGAPKGGALTEKHV